MTDSLTRIKNYESINYNELNEKYSKGSDLYLGNIVSYCKIFVNGLTVRNFGCLHTYNDDFNKYCEHGISQNVEDYIYLKLEENKDKKGEIIDFYLETEFFPSINREIGEYIDPILRSREIYKKCFVDRNNIENYHELCKLSVKNNNEINARFHFLDFRVKVIERFSPIEILISMIQYKSFREYNGEIVTLNGKDIFTVIIIFIYFCEKLIKRGEKIDLSSETFYSETYESCKKFLTNYEKISKIEINLFKSREEWVQNLENNRVVDFCKTNISNSENYGITKNGFSRASLKLDKIDNLDQKYKILTNKIDEIFILFLDARLELMDVRNMVYSLITIGSLTLDIYLISRMFYNILSPEYEIKNSIILTGNSHAEVYNYIMEEFSKNDEIKSIIDIKIDFYSRKNSIATCSKFIE